ncbi:GUN4 domain-containing protein [Pleurocapsales cyanobacterium LEGE 06147]|nr:GUN4 domain-containing protein [Pleurocapsales cyanobacterium LEGE 06147]
MSYCLNPHCLKPQNLLTEKFCLNCKTPLLLKNRYRAIKTIGQGGMGRTFLATDEEDKLSESPRVIKQFFPQTRETNSLQKAIELFAAEAVRLDELGQHSQIPRLYDYFTQNGHQYLVQEWIEGDNLAQILEKEGIFREQSICHLLNNLLPVLTFVHDRQIIHRDIKPENIIRRLDGTLVLVDFGAAKALTGKALCQTGTVIGSPEYIAPEQLRGKAVVSSDIYSLGVTCLHLLTGISPFDLYSDSEDTWVWRDYLADNPITIELGQILDKMIARAIARRYQSTQAVLQDLIAHIITFSEFAVSPQEKIPESSETEPTEPILISEQGIDYTQLRDLLEAKQWQQANQATEQLLLQAAHQDRRGWLEKDDLDNLSCEDLYIIDRLWVNYSEKHFGFSVQHGIWQDLEEKNYQNFGKQVGWYFEGRWLLTKQINFSFSAPRGHLPAMSWWFGHAIWGLKGLFLRMDACLAK